MPTRGSGFIGLGQYLGANRSAGERMGGDLAKRLEEEERGARGAVDTARSDFTEQVAMGTPTPFSAPSTYGLDAAEVDAMVPGLEAQKNAAEYTGPTEFSVDPALDRQVAAAQQQGQLAATEPGISVLLAKGAGSPGAGYTTGGRMLDAALANRGGGERLNTAASNLQKLKEYLGTAKSTAAGAVTRAQGASQQAQAGAQAEIDRIRGLRTGAPPPVAGQPPQTQLAATTPQPGVAGQYQQNMSQAEREAEARRNAMRRRP